MLTYKVVKTLPHYLLIKTFTDALLPKTYPDIRSTTLYCSLPEMARPNVEHKPCMLIDAFYIKLSENTTILTKFLSPNAKLNPLLLEIN